MNVAILIVLSVERTGLILYTGACCCVGKQTAGYIRGPAPDSDWGPAVSFAFYRLCVCCGV